LTRIPGIGVLTATALVAAVGNAQTFACGRDLRRSLRRVGNLRSDRGACARRGLCGCRSRPMASSWTGSCPRR
jgi:transposase